MGLRASKRDPFDDDDKEEKTPEAEPEDDAPVKELPVDPDPNEEPEGDGEEAKLARRERRANRFKEAEQARIAAEERAAAAERAAAEASAARVAAETTARMVAEQARSQGPQKDMWTAALEEVQEKRKAIGLEYDALVASGKYDQAAKERLQAAYAKTEERFHEIVAHRSHTMREAQAQRNPVDHEGQARTAAVAAQLQVKYPDILANPRAAAYMNMTYMRATQAEGRPNNWDTADQIAAETRRAFRIGTPPQADATTRARYSGMSSNGAGPSGGASDGKIAMLPKYKKMAHSRFPNLPEAQAEKKWAQTVGKKILEGEG